MASRSRIVTATTAASWSRISRRKGLKSKTVRKKLAWPTAAVNLAIADGTLNFNPFAAVAPKKKDSTRR